MEADWEFEVGGEAPVIEAYWPGLVDLRSTPERASGLAETIQLPGLAAALEALNAESSYVWTSKCDFWPLLDSDEFDPDELNAPAVCSANTMSCFIDLLAREERAWALPAKAEAECRRICALLNPVPLRCCRADLVIRRAYIGSEHSDLGITAYITACGSSSSEAKVTLRAALTAFVHALLCASKLQ